MTVQLVPDYMVAVNTLQHATPWKSSAAYVLSGLQSHAYPNLRHGTNHGSDDWTRDVSEIEFIKHEYGKVKKSPRPLLYDPWPERLRCTTEEVETLKQRLTDIDSSAALLHVLNTHTVHTCTLPTTLPQVPSMTREEIMRELQLKPQPLTLEDIFTAGTHFVCRITHCPALVQRVEKERTLSTLDWPFSCKGPEEHSNAYMYIAI